MRTKYASMTLLATAVLTSSGSAATTTFQNSIDTTLIQDNGDRNYGIRNEILLGAAGGGRQRAGLIEFDVTTLAGTYASIESVTVRLVVARVATPTNTWNLSLMREANDGWVQGTENGVAQVGSPSWNFAAYDPATPTEWAGGQSGARLATDVYGSMGTMTFTEGTTLAGDVIDVTLDPSGLAANVDTLTEIFDLWTAGTNAGIQIYGGTGQWGVYSAEATGTIGTTPGTLADRPQLIVEYTPVPEPSGIVLVGLAVGGVIASRRRTTIVA